MAKDATFLHADNENESDCADKQADLCLRWAHMSEGTFSHVASYLFTNKNRIVSPDFVKYIHPMVFLS